MNTIIQKVKKARTMLADYQTKKATIEGRKSQLLSDLENKFGCSSIKEGQELLVKLNTKLEEEKTTLTALVVKLDEAMGNESN